MKPLDVLLTLLGVGCVMYGLQAIYPPAAWIVFGWMAIRAASEEKKGT